MTIEEKLKDLILSRYMSIREFTIAVDLPYSTMSSIFQRGVENTSLHNIIKICDKLNISVDALANGEIEYRPTLKQPRILDIRDVVNDAKSKLEFADQITVDGKTIDIESTEPISEALDIGYQIMKRKANATNKTDNT